MKKYFLAAAIAVLFSSLGHAQDLEVHSDIEFGFAPDSEELEFEIENDTVNDDGFQVFEGSFGIALGNESTTDNPGFITPVDEGLTVNQGDNIFVRVLNAGQTEGNTIGSGFVNFYDPNTPAAGIQSDGGTITVIGNDPNDPDGDIAAVFDGDVPVSLIESLFLAQGSDGTFISDLPPSLLGDEEGDEQNIELGVGEIHNHLNFTFAADAGAPSEFAVGLLLQFEADLASVAGDGIDVVSDPFFVVFNNGLSEEVFETQALPAFGVNAVPEPTSGILLAAVGSAILTRRRRRRI